MSETTTMNLGELAGQAYAQFERRERDTENEHGDKSFVVLKDDRPDWLYDLVYEAHGGDFLPDDWKFEKIRAILGALHDYNVTDEHEANEQMSEICDGQVDVYNHARALWLASNLNRAGYCEEAADEMGFEGGDVNQLIGLGQYAELEEIFASVVSSLTERLEELELEADDDE